MAFVRGKHTNTAIAEFIKRVYKSMDETKISMGLFLDLSKAFELAKRIFLRKMAGMGIRGVAQKWKLHIAVEKLMKLLTVYRERDP
jgi:hypothetical protein